MGTTFGQFRRFSTDAQQGVLIITDGLERILRFLQACVQILLSLVTSSVDVLNTAVAIFDNRDIRRTLAELSSRLGLVRRFIRFFRFFDAFSSSYETFASLNDHTAGKRADDDDDDDDDDGTFSTVHLEKTLNVLAGTFNGLYLLLEAMTLVDALDIDGLTALGPELESVFKVESQRCWFIALAFGALACVLRLSRLQDAKMVKPMRAKTPDEKNAEVDADRVDGSIEPRSHAAKTAAQKWRVSRKMVACLLDMALPGSVIGWVPASKGTVGVVMLTTSVLTGLDVWERCGKEIGRL